MELIFQIRPNIAVSFAEESGFASGRKRVKRAVENSNKMLEFCLLNRPEGTKIYANVQGGRFSELRGKSAEFVNASSADGFYLGAMHDYASISDFTAVLQTTCKVLDSRPKILGGVNGPIELTIGFVFGIDSFETSFPFSRKNKAVYFDKLDGNSVEFAEVDYS
jgi:tRNA-guanine family transglycosylase